MVLLAGCATEGEYVGPGPAYVEPYPYYDPFFYGPDVYIAPGYRYPRHYYGHRYGRSYGHRYYDRAPHYAAPNAHTIPVPSAPLPNIGRPPGTFRGGDGGAHNIPVPSSPGRNYRRGPRP
jgi:hypothetical protein